MITSYVDLGGVVFPDYATSGWSFRQLSGWWGQTTDKRELVERPQGHGAFQPSSSLRTSRAISLEVTFIGSQAEQEAALDSLSAVGAEGPVVMTVTVPDGSSWRVVTVVGVSVLAHRAGSRSTRAAVDCVAADPRRYADAGWETTGVPSGGLGLVFPVVFPAVWPGGGSDGRITLVNSGLAPSSPVFRLVGGFDDATITCVETGARLMVTYPTAVGVTVDVDVASRRALINGQDVSRWLRFREWEDVPPGESRSYQLDASNPVDAGLEGRVFPAWW